MLNQQYDHSMWNKQTLSKEPFLYNIPQHADRQRPTYFQYNGSIYE